MTRFPSFYGWMFHHLSLSYVYIYIYIGVYTPGGAIGKECTCQCRRHTRKCGFDPWVGKIPWSRKWQLTLVFLPGKYHGQRSQGYRGLQSWATVGLQRVWHHWVTEHVRARAYTHNKLCAGYFMIWAVLPHPSQLWCPVVLAWGLRDAASDSFSEAVESHHLRAEWKNAGLKFKAFCSSSCCLLPLQPARLCQSL